jgi:hypothetical protein
VAAFLDGLPREKVAMSLGQAGFEDRGLLFESFIEDCVVFLGHGDSPSRILRVADKEEAYFNG